MNIRQCTKEIVARYLLSHAEHDHLIRVVVLRTNAIDAGDRGDNDHILSPLDQSGRRLQSQPIDFIVDGHVLLNVGVRRRDVCFGLIVIVIGNEKLDRVVGEKALELSIQLCGQRFVVRNDERGFVDLRDHIGNGESLSAAGHTEKSLKAIASLHALDQLTNRLRLIAGWFVFGNELEFSIDHDVNS